MQTCLGFEKELTKNKLHFYYFGLKCLMPSDETKKNKWSLERVAAAFKIKKSAFAFLVVLNSVCCS